MMLLLHSAIISHCVSLPCGYNIGANTKKTLWYLQFLQLSKQETENGAVSLAQSIESSQTGQEIASNGALSREVCHKRQKRLAGGPEQRGPRLSASSGNMSWGASEHSGGQGAATLWQKKDTSLWNLSWRKYQAPNLAIRCHIIKELN